MLWLLYHCVDLTFGLKVSHGTSISLLRHVSTFTIDVPLVYEVQCRCVSRLVRWWHSAASQLQGPWFDPELGISNVAVGFLWGLWFPPVYQVHQFPPP